MKYEFDKHAETFFEAMGKDMDAREMTDNQLVRMAYTSVCQQQCLREMLSKVEADSLGLDKVEQKRIRAIAELMRRRYEPLGVIISSPNDAYPLVRHFADKKQEHFVSVALDGAHAVIDITLVTTGLVNRTLVHPREVFAPALEKRATAIIVAHNHPSKKLFPSNEDKDVTTKLKLAGELLGIEVLDHLIFSEESFYSLLEGGEF